MNEIAIQAAGVSKRYRLGERRAKYKALRDVIAGAVSGTARRARALVGTKEPEKKTEELWALRDVSFDIQHGELIGIIGRNGAGKSTLLKILSRITEPTMGSVRIHGRVGSLLEVGTGFHPELTGGENIYLNGVILGMRRKEIDRKFDEIVAFAEIEKFLDTPVKYYSSGMYMRLAFAVAAHLEPEILIVDEVLAVGDSSFQRKCLDKMEEVGKRGRTVLFVSHNMPAITRLCERTILLDEGKVLADGPSHQVVSAYLRSGVGTTAEREWPDIEKAPGFKVARLRAVRVRRGDGTIAEAADIRQPVGIEIEYDVLQTGHRMTPGIDFYNEDGVCVFGALENEARWNREPRPLGRYVTTAWVPGNLLSEGTILVNVEMISIHPPETHFRERQVVAFQVVDSMDGDSARGEYAGHWEGVVRPKLTWESRLAGGRLAEGTDRPLLADGG